MKYISFAIPCYNSEAYMEKAIQSILPGGEDVEIIVVNDGSSDGTSEVAKKYEEKYPGIVKAVDKENGGHGDAVNTGLAHATGVYFKVVDSDDWVDEEALLKILSAVKGFVDADSKVDMLISNYVYEKVGMTHKKVIHYRNVLPQNQVFRWDDIGSFHLDQYILMHSVIYRTEMDVDFYRYFIGREDQSVNEKVMISRIDQQIYVTKSMISMYELRMVESKKLRKYMINYLAIMMTVSSILCIRSKVNENLKKKKELWVYLKKKDYRTYVKIRYGILGQTMNLPGKSGRKVSSMAYSVARRLIGFN